MRVLFIINDPTTDIIQQHSGLDGMVRRSLSELSKITTTTPSTTPLDIISIAPHLHRMNALAASESLPRDDATLNSFDCILMSGSVYNVTDMEPWMQALIAWLQFIVKRNQAAMKKDDDESPAQQQPLPLPIFAICFSHQLAHLAFGGEVSSVVSEGKDEWGSFPLSFHKTDDVSKDPVFGPVARYAAEIKRDVCVNVTHSQSVVKLAPGSVSIAGTKKHEHHATVFQHNCLLWSVQFHPECRVDYLKAVLAVDNDEKGVSPYHRPAPPFYQDPETDFSAMFLASFFDFALKLKMKR